MTAPAPPSSLLSTSLETNGEQPDRVVVPPLAFGIADAEALDDWMRKAQAGDRFVLARGRVRPTFAPVWQGALVAERLGLVTVVAVPHEELAGQWVWLAECRVTEPTGAREDARATLRRADGGKANAEPRTSDGELVTDVILRLVKRAANLGQSAPSLNDLAKACELNSGQAARHWLIKLVGRKRIRIEDDHDPMEGARRRLWVIEPDGAKRATRWAKLQGGGK